MGILPSPHGGLEIQIAKPPSIENSIGSVQGITFFYNASCWNRRQNWTNMMKQAGTMGQSTHDYR